MSNAKPRAPRLGRGLSSLMGRAVEVVVPTAPMDAKPATAHAPATAASDHQPPAATPSPQAAASTAPASSTPTAQVDARTGPAAASATPPADAVAPTPDRDGLVNLPVHAIRPNPHQPRQRFDETALHQLAESIKTDGVIQPILVRPLTDAQRAAAATATENITHELVAGERRWRAARLAGLTHVPAIVRTLDDRTVAEWALIENLQREDLNPIERAEAFQRLIQQFNLSHDDVANRVGVERSSVTNALRLLGLDESVRGLVADGLLTGGHAKALAALVEPVQQRLLGERAVKQAWSVRQLEQAVRHASGQTSIDAYTAKLEAAVAKSNNGAVLSRSAHLSDLEEQVGRQLRTKVHIRPGRKKGSGTLTIEFYTVDQFDALMAKLGVETE